MRINELQLYVGVAEHRREIMKSYTYKKNISVCEGYEGRRQGH